MISRKPTRQRLYLPTTFLEKHYSLLSLEGRVATFSTFSITRHKAKAIPLQAWTGPEGSTSLILPDFKTVGT
jgi:hypothetical protein